MLKLKKQKTSNIHVVYPWQNTREPRRVRWRWLAATVAVVTATTLLPALWPDGQQAQQAQGAGQSLPASASLVAAKKIFAVSEQPLLHLNFAKHQVGFGRFSFGLGQAAAAEAITTEVTYNNHPVNVPVNVTPDGAGYSLKLAPKNDSDIKPGSYTVQAKWGNGGQQKTATQTFAWGVLAINTTQPAYTAGQTVHIEMGVLSSTGHTLCKAPISLTITAPDKQTQAVDVQNSAVCNGDSFVEVPDYTAIYQPAATGHYTMHLRLAESDYTIDDGFDVSTQLPFVVERTAPTRLFPPHAYSSTITVTANRAFKGTVTERLPAGFSLQDLPDNGQPAASGGSTNVKTWQVDWKKGDHVSLSYNFKAPLKSPAAYKLSPLTFSDGSQTIYREPRSWQIAGDAVVTFVKQTAGAAVSGTAFSVTSTAGNTLVLAISTASGATGGITSVTDSASQTWTAGPTIGVSGVTNTFEAMYYIVNSSAITTITITTGNSTPAYNVSEYTNVVTTSSLDQSTQLATTVSATTQTGASITTTNANDLIVGAMSHGGGSGATGGVAGTSTPGTFNALTEGNNGTTHAFAAYQVVSATGTARVDWTISASSQAGMGILALKGGSASAAPTTDQLMRGGNYFSGGVEQGFFWAG